MARLKKVCPVCDEQYVRGSRCASGHPPVEPIIAIEKYLITREEWSSLTPAEQEEIKAAGLTAAGIAVLRESLRDAYVVRVNVGDAPAVLKQFPREPFDVWD